MRFLQFFRQRYYRHRVKVAINLLFNLDRLMKEAGYSRQVRREFQRKYSKSKAKEEVLVNLCMEKKK